jgi:hypothetical protein
VIEYVRSAEVGEFEICGIRDFKLATVTLLIGLFFC